MLGECWDDSVFAVLFLYDVEDHWKRSNVESNPSTLLTNGSRRTRNRLDRCRRHRRDDDIPRGRSNEFNAKPDINFYIGRVQSLALCSLQSKNRNKGAH